MRAGIALIDRWLPRALGIALGFGLPLYLCWDDLVWVIAVAGLVTSF